MDGFSHIAKAKKEMQTYNPLDMKYRVGYVFLFFLFLNSVYKVGYIYKNLKLKTKQGFFSEHYFKHPVCFYCTGRCIHFVYFTAMEFVYIHCAGVLKH